jgi:mannan endo-1,6-alpha-mannosidase
MNFKGFLAQYLALVTRMAPYTTDDINALLQSSATAAASHCNAGTNGTMCTMFWTVNDGPATLGVGQQMSALNVFNANLLKFVSNSATVVTSSSGGTSQGNPNAGNTDSDQVYTYKSLVYCADDRIPPPTAGDRILAGVLTALVSVGSVGFAAWLAI